MSLLEDARLRAYVVEAAGEEGIRLIELLEGKREATDSELAEKLGEKPSHVRKILYHLFEARIAEYTKEKDKETGWLTFFWHLTPQNAEHALEQRRVKTIEGLKSQLENETVKDWYVCPKDQTRYDFSAASDVNFHCGDCGTLLDHQDNAKLMADIQRNIRALEQEARQPTTSA